MKSIRHGRYHKETLKIKIVVLLNNFLHIERRSRLLSINTNVSDHFTDWKLPLNNLSTMACIYLCLYPTGSYGAPRTLICHRLNQHSKENSGQASRYTFFFPSLMCFNPSYYMKVDEKHAWILFCSHSVFSFLFSFPFFNI